MTRRSRDSFSVRPRSGLGAAVGAAPFDAGAGEAAAGAAAGAAAAGACGVGVAGVVAAAGAGFGGAAEAHLAFEFGDLLGLSADLVFEAGVDAVVLVGGAGSGRRGFVVREIARHDGRR